MRTIEVKTPRPFRCLACLARLVRPSATGGFAGKFSLGRRDRGRCRSTNEAGSTPRPFTRLCHLMLRPGDHRPRTQEHAWDLDQGRGTLFADQSRCLAAPACSPDAPPLAVSRSAEMSPSGIAHRREAPHAAGIRLRVRARQPVAAMTVSDVIGRHRHGNRSNFGRLRPRVGTEDYSGLRLLPGRYTIIAGMGGVLRFFEADQVANSRKPTERTRVV